MGPGEGRRLIQQRWLEERRALEAQVAAEDAAAEKKATQALGRLIADHKPPEREDMRKTHDNAMKQWAARRGAVGPMGEEDSNALLRYFNNPKADNFELDQRWAYQHDMQATDAEDQALNGPLDSTHKNARYWRKSAYDFANKKSAIQGMIVLRRTGDMDKALAETQRIFKEHGFDVKRRY